MNPEDVARAAVRDEKSILEFTKSRMDSMDGKVCQRIPALQEELQNRFQLLRKANEHRKSNFETVVGEFSDERQLYFQLRQERDQQLLNMKSSREKTPLQIRLMILRRMLNLVLIAFIIQ